MGLILTTDDRNTKVYRKERTSENGNTFITYSIMTSSKNGDEWINGFLDVVFPKGTNLEHKTEIKIKNAFPMVSTYNGKTYIKWYIKEFDVVGTAQAPTTDSDGFMNVPEDSDDELPFARSSTR